MRIVLNDEAVAHQDHTGGALHKGDRRLHRDLRADAMGIADGDGYGQARLRHGVLFASVCLRDRQIA